MAREFKIERHVELPGTPEDAWEAVATAAGNSAWLFSDGVGADAETAVVWDPPNHLVVRMQEGDWFNALEFQIQAKDGSHTTLRYVHSGIFTDDWDNQYDAADAHTDFYLHTLTQYLEHFNGRAVNYIGDAPFGIQGPESSRASDGLDRLRSALGLSQDSKEGDLVHLTPAMLDPIDGVIDYLRTNFIGIRTSDSLIRIFGRNAFGHPVGVSIHDFSGHTDPGRLKQAWKHCLDEAFASS
jgi:hypothetical protein